MGRSRLVYRAKHKGILSENSRKQIREAHRREREETPVELNQPTIKEEDFSSSDQEEIQGGVDVLSEPKFYIRDSEYSDYLKENRIDIQRNSLINENESVCKLLSALSFTELGLADLECYDEKSHHSERNEGHSPVLEPAKVSSSIGVNLTENPTEKSEESAVLSTLDDILGF